MKKRLAIGLALVACLAAGSAAMAIAKPKVKKVDTTLTLGYSETITTPSGPYGPSEPSSRSVFSGDVKAKKGCKKNRKVSIPGVGDTKSASDGGYAVSLDTAAPPGTYQATAKKKKIKKHGKKIVCKKGKSNTVEVS